MQKRLLKVAMIGLLLLSVMASKCGKEEGVIPPLAEEPIQQEPQRAEEVQGDAQEPAAANKKEGEDFDGEADESEHNEEPSVASSANPTPAPSPTPSVPSTPDAPIPAVVDAGAKCVHNPGYCSNLAKRKLPCGDFSQVAKRKDAYNVLCYKPDTSAACEWKSGDDGKSRLEKVCASVSGNIITKQARCLITDGCTWEFRQKKCQVASDALCAERAISPIKNSDACFSSVGNRKAIAYNHCSPESNNPDKCEWMPQNYSENKAEAICNAKDQKACGTSPVCQWQAKADAADENASH